MSVDSASPPAPARRNELLSVNEILERKRKLEVAAEQRLTDSADSQAGRAQGLQYVKPFSSTYGGVVEALENPHDRFNLGLAQIDVLTRGFGPKELIIVVGFAHQGKTQIINTAILNNRDKRILFFSMDDPAEMILIKLVCMVEDVDAETLERRVREGDEATKRALREAATAEFKNLICVDDSLGLGQMSQAVEEATRFWGAPPQVVVLDYLQSMAGNGHDDFSDDGGVKRKVSALKRWVKDKPFPTIILHQGSRSNAPQGAPITMRSGAYGAEQEATMLLGVRRKRDFEELDEWQRQEHANTVTVHLVKNKRPPSKITHNDGVDFYMDPNTGLIRHLRDSDITRASANAHTAPPASAPPMLLHPQGAPMTNGRMTAADAMRLASGS